MSDKDNELIERALILFNEGPDEWTRQEGFEAANILKSIATRLREVKEENDRWKKATASLAEKLGRSDGELICIRHALLENLPEVYHDWINSTFGDQARKGNEQNS